MAANQALARFIRDTLMSGPSVPEFFAATETAGFDVASALDLLARPFDHFRDEDAQELEELLYDPIYELAEHYGVQRASEIASRTTCWSDIDVSRHHAGIRSWLRLEDAITSAAPLADVYALIKAPEISDERRSWVSHRIARAYPLAELARLAPHMAEAHSQVTGERLRQDLSPLTAFEQLQGAVDDAVLLRAIERFWGIRPEFASDDLNAMVVRYVAQLCRLEFRPLNLVLRFAAQRGEADSWLPILRECGLKGAQAALYLLETGWKVPAIAERLTRAGYDDEAAMTALLENGVGTRRSLALLRDEGWSVEQLVETLHHRGLLAPEIRDHLDELGVPRAAHAALLLSVCDAAVVNRVLDRIGSDRILPKSTKTGRGSVGQ